MINNISFANAYVHEGKIFAEKEVEKATKKMKEAMNLDWMRRVIMGDGDEVHKYVRPDASVPALEVDNRYIESYVLSHGGNTDTAKTIAIV